MIKENYTSNINAKARKWLIKIDKFGKIKKIKFTPSNSALMVVDMQNFFLDEKSHAFVPSGRDIVPNIKKLIKKFRDRGLPVIFTCYALKKGEHHRMMEKWWKDIVREKTRDSEITDELKPDTQDILIRKTNYSAFYGTELEQILKKKNIKSLVITGVMTHLCCDMAARESFIRGFETHFVIDATATYNEELHMASLIALSHGFAVPTTTNEIINIMLMHLTPPICSDSEATASFSLPKLKEAVS